MRPFKCPHCQSEMNYIKEPDMSTDRCPSCGGLFLEKGELNALASSMKGNIEYSSIQSSEDLTAKFPIRDCPKCSGKKMEKVNLLAFSDIIFDYCSSCESFFLDKGELKEMNNYLKELTPHGVEQEYRDYKDGHLVRIERRQNVYIASPGLAGMRTRAVDATNICITVYFTKQLNTDLRVFQEKWFAQLAKSIGLYKVQDIPTGNVEFDKIFRVQGDDEKAIASALPNEFCQELVDFVSNDPKIYQRNGSFEITSDFICYMEGPYEPNKMPHLLSKAEPMIEKMLSLAKLLEKAG